MPEARVDQRIPASRSTNNFIVGNGVPETRAKTWVIAGTFFKEITTAALPDYAREQSGQQSDARNATA